MPLHRASLSLCSDSARAGYPSGTSTLTVTKTSFSFVGSTMTTCFTRALASGNVPLARNTPLIWAVGPTSDDGVCVNVCACVCVCVCVCVCCVCVWISLCVSASVCASVVGHCVGSLCGAGAAWCWWCWWCWCWCWWCWWCCVVVVLVVSLRGAGGAGFALRLFLVPCPPMITFFFSALHPSL
jgi:hypothetical protein